MTILSEVRPGAYYDSVILMQLQRSLVDLPGVIDAGVVMATPANKELLAASGLAVDTTAGSDDLLIVVKAGDEETAGEALNQVDSLLARRRSGISQEFRPHSLDLAVKQLPEAQWTLISVPGRYAAAVARKSLDHNLNVFLFSDNVSLEDEVELKNIAREKGLLVMGPDCGTAIINGIGLGFANYVRNGSIGIVAASGTGLQAISTEIHNLGNGVSQAIGTGGRDLSSEVGAITAYQGLDILARDDQTEVILIVSKPPQPEVATLLLAFARRVGKPVVVEFIGYPPPARRIGNIHFASGLSDAARLAVQLSKERAGILSSDGNQADNGLHQGYLRGLFSGGTLAYEALLGLQAFLTPISSNLAIHESQRMVDIWKSQGHTILDLGEDEFTQGRLHPMIDNDLRLRRLQQEAADPEVSFILLDIVLGAGAHPDPASELGPAVAKIREEATQDGRSLEIVAIVVGTDADPQDIDHQVNQMQKAGAVVFPDTTGAVEYVSQKMSVGIAPSFKSVALNIFREPLAGINVGLEIFFDSLRDQGAKSIQVDWRPPAGGDEKLMNLLAKLK
jgi:FdrA protein